MNADGEDKRRRAVILPPEVWHRIFEYLPDMGSPWKLGQLAVVSGQILRAMPSFRGWTRIRGTMDDVPVGMERAADDDMAYVVGNLNCCCCQCLLRVRPEQLQWAAGWSGPHRDAQLLCVGRCFPLMWRRFHRRHAMEMAVERHEAHGMSERVEEANAIVEYDIPAAVIRLVPHDTRALPLEYNPQIVHLYVRWDLECMRLFLHG